ncbi:hypothetical protein Trco_007712 [Trichoderma cornu-damae]|uniref:L-dopachrome isomerase n=1 Tax=Trichoderma cornu-damae TaxID=654480 RepID=A0A9P8TRN8_9HYPO|nr:hypothetical protein Trco_007712 [Trichoderma cornu-damae]
MDQPNLLFPQTRKSPVLNSGIAKPPQDPAAAPPPPSPEPKPKPKPKSKMSSSLETVPEGDHRAMRASSPDDAITRTASPTSRSDRERLAEKRSQYFHDALHERSGRNAAAEAVRKDALIHAQVETNVKIENEGYFLTTFSHQLAARYNRYPASTVVSLHHSQTLFFSGSSHPAYTLTITALPSEVQPATNRRNAAVLQRHMEAVLRIPASRGMVRFVAAAEECLAWGGKTVAGRITDAMSGVREAAAPGEGEKTHERRILKSLSLRRPPPADMTPPSTQPPTPSKQGQESAASCALQTEPADLLGPEAKTGVIKKKKSIIHTLFRTSRAEGGDPSPSGS